MQPFSIFSLDRVLLVAIQEDIDDTGIDALIDRISALVRSRRAKGVIIDLHDVEVVDSYLADHLSHLHVILRALEAHMVVVGLSVPAVITLLDLGIHMEDLHFALDMEQAFGRIMASGAPGP